MTIREVCIQLYDLSVDGHFNGEKFSQTQLINYVRNSFRPEVNLHGDNKLVMMIELPDGVWYFYIVQYDKGQFDYYIPDTREQEKRVITILN